MIEDEGKDVFLCKRDGASKFKVGNNYIYIISRLLIYEKNYFYKITPSNYNDDMFSIYGSGYISFHDLKRDFYTGKYLLTEKNIIKF